MSPAAKNFLAVAVGALLIAFAYRAIVPARADQYAAVYPGLHYVMKPNGDVYCQRGTVELAEGPPQFMGNFWSATLRPSTIRAALDARRAPADTSAR